MKSVRAMAARVQAQQNPSVVDCRSVSGRRADWRGHGGHWGILGYLTPVLCPFRVSSWHLEISVLVEPLGLVDWLRGRLLHVRTLGINFFSLSFGLLLLHVRVWHAVRL